VVASTIGRGAVAVSAQTAIYVLVTDYVITTDRKTYDLSLASVRRTATVTTSWIYPQDQLIVLKSAEAHTPRDGADHLGAIGEDRHTFPYPKPRTVT
jgi:hypothetical protein